MRKTSSGSPRAVIVTPFDYRGHPLSSQSSLVLHWPKFGVGAWSRNCEVFLSLLRSRKESPRCQSGIDHARWDHSSRDDWIRKVLTFSTCSWDVAVETRMLTAALTTGEDWPSGIPVPVGRRLMGQQVGFFLPIVFRLAVQPCGCLAWPNDISHRLTVT